MQAITHLPFMRVMHAFGGPDYFVTEYFRVYEGYVLDKNILRSITENATGRPVDAQLIGQHIPSLVRISKELLEFPTSGIDLNLGCPAPVVCRKDAGGGLLRKPDHLNRILEALRKSIPGRFTVKTRLGYESPEEFTRLIEIFSQHGLDALTIHARTVRERYQTPIHPEQIRFAVQTMPCPVIANGNVVDVSTGQNLIAQTMADGLMIGRGAIRSPWIFKQLRNAYAGEPVQTITRADLLEYINLLYDTIADDLPVFDEQKHVNHMKKYLVYIVQGLDTEFEHQIRRATTGKNFKQTCLTFLDSREPVPVFPPNHSKLFCGFDTLR
ncbi:tRNA-dihydrouridine synthase family protein [Verrucomicrobiaceae bacterium N1E253]|uniref:tRNA-dihydrouridine synthase n=1 Tax=Oceaniferula marina TaxID=2748318 RepID=A0A851GMQ1_9BACT|nr:tRNA-dihydrouridine synthase family protein [Oceaniferula marina]NWK56317.1 tRNA-dihydrouridine synthase family protein [Oceaniferula marina]